MRLFLGIFLGCGAATLAACSSGTEVSATFSSPSGGESPGSGGAGAAAPDGSASSASGASSGTSSSASSSGSGGQGGADGCDHSATQTCITAIELPGFYGDADGEPSTAKGTKAAWYKVLITEDSILSKDLSYTATLVSPPGMVFQLFAFNGDATTPNCLGEALVAVGDPPSVSSSWSDVAFSDDDRWISFEVRYISGEVCDPAPEWTLTVTGHTQ
jgi:hypothetical protein